MIFKYSNGWGHLIMSLAAMAAGLYLYVNGNPAIGTSLISIVVAAWFVPGAAKQVASEVTDQVVKTTTPKNPLN